MSSPFADQPAALPQAPTIQILCSAPSNSPDCALVLASTARTSSGATLPITRVKRQLVALAAVGYMVLHSLHSYSMPPTPEPTENNQARIQHGGFLRDTFQVCAPRTTIGKKRCSTASHPSLQSMPSIGQPQGAKPESRLSRSFDSL